MLRWRSRQLYPAVLARVGVGIGESASGPASHSLIADYFPPERRAGAMGVYGAAVPFGAFIALAGGGWIVENFDWRVAFFVAGIPGLLVGLIVWLTVKEPRGPYRCVKHLNHNQIS